MKKVLRKLRCESGQSLVEYALLVGFVVGIIVLVLGTAAPLRTAITSLFTRITNQINAAG